MIGGVHRCPLGYGGPERRPRNPRRERRKRLDIRECAHVDQRGSRRSLLAERQRWERRSRRRCVHARRRRRAGRKRWTGVGSQPGRCGRTRWSRRQGRAWRRRRTRRRRREHLDPLRRISTRCRARSGRTGRWERWHQRVGWPGRSWRGRRDGRVGRIRPGPERRYRPVVSETEQRTARLPRDARTIHDLGPPRSGQLGIPASPQCLRHQFATDAVAAGISSRRVRRGGARRASTACYPDTYLVVIC